MGTESLVCVRAAHAFPSWPPGTRHKSKPVPSCSVWKCTFLISALLPLCLKHTNLWAPNVGRASVGNRPIALILETDTRIPDSASKQPDPGVGVGTAGAMQVTDPRSWDIQSLIQPLNAPQAQRLYRKSLRGSSSARWAPGSTGLKARFSLPGPRLGRCHTTLGQQESPQGTARPLAPQLWLGLGLFSPRLPVREPFDGVLGTGRPVSITSGPWLCCSGRGTSHRPAPPFAGTG